MLLRRWAGSVLRHRHRNHRDSARSRLELRRMAILEAAADMPAHERALATPMQSSSLSPVAGTSAALQSIDDVVEAACGRFAPVGAEARPDATGLFGSSSVQKAASMSHFMSECRRLRREVGECRDPHNRRLLRETLRSFWMENVDGALACCALHGRDFGFVADFGLTDDALHVSFASLQLALHCVVQEKSTCSCMSMMTALHYMARELDYLEKTYLRAPAHGRGRQEKQKVREVAEEEKRAANCTGVGGTNQISMKTPPPSVEALEVFRHTIATVGVERIHLFFLQRGTADRVLGSAEEALHALEFLAVVKATDADESTRALVEDRKRQGCVSIDQYLLTTLFRHISSNHRELRFTSVVHAFKLLRIFMPLLCPAPPPPPLPQQHQQRQGNKGLVVAIKTDLDAAHEILGCAAAGNGASRELREWQAQRDTMDRIVWGLCTALQRKDARFVNPFHYVQIMATLSRLPPYILSRAPRPRRQALQNLEALTTMGADEAARNTETVAAAAPAAEKQETSERRSMIVDGKTSHTAEEMWEYIIAKTCIFIPSLTSSQRCRACRGLRLAVLKRESALARSSRGDARRSASMSLAETLLLPMAHELSRYPKDYEAAMFSRAPDEKG